jgi:hypothetical protein
MPHPSSSADISLAACGNVAPKIVVETLSATLAKEHGDKRDVLIRKDGGNFDLPAERGDVLSTSPLASHQAVAYGQTSALGCSPRWKASSASRSISSINSDV